MNYLIKNAELVNEGKRFYADILVKNGIIEKIASQIQTPAQEKIQEVNAEKLLCLPGIIDDQVHFREPGLTHKGDFFTESRAALAGGVTAVIEQPNTVPNTTSIQALEDKIQLATGKFWTNFAFNLGGANNNLEEIKKAHLSQAAGIKVFMGSSTGNMLVDQEKSLEGIFSQSPLLIITHCEDEASIKANQAKYEAEVGREKLTAAYHPIIRNAEACYLSSSYAASLAKKFDARLHIYHISTGIETELFRNDIPLIDKKITSEACVHHLWFCDEDYAEKGNFIKWNPAVKSAQDREKIWQAVADGRIDILATDHAPHTLEEKTKNYADAPAGGPLVQHFLQAMLDFVDQGKLSLELMVEKMCHNPAILFRIQNKGYLREGYDADITLVSKGLHEKVDASNILYKCAWSPFEGYTFRNKVTHTFVNGFLAYEKGIFHGTPMGKNLRFER